MFSAATLDISLEALNHRLGRPRWGGHRVGESREKGERTTVEVRKGVQSQGGILPALHLSSAVLVSRAEPPQLRVTAHTGPQDP